jgi:hypothetical protein
MINSGLSLLRALTILGEQTGNKRLAEIVTQVRAEVEKGSSLSAAMAKHPRAFNRLYISMVRAGEVGGFLDQVLVKVAETFEKEVELRGKIRSAMTYPVVVFVMVLLIVGGMLIFIVPTFKNLYTSLGGTLPLPTRLLIGVSDAMKRFFPLVQLATPLAKHPHFPPSGADDGRGATEGAPPRPAAAATIRRPGCSRCGCGVGGRRRRSRGGGPAGTGSRSRWVAGGPAGRPASRPAPWRRGLRPRRLGRRPGRCRPPARRCGWRSWWCP